ncbi:MAG: NUDIX hydrolase [Micrococcales bacterium]|nr:NUDIX hydrolase [Micrococcales bacterium]
MTHDEARAQPVAAHEAVWHGRVFDVVADRVDLGGPEPVRREYTVHPGAVAVIALDGADRVLLLQQYRHPVRHALWEPPAGLLDVPGEPEVAAGRRELAEEADLIAGRWWHLVTFFTSPGASDERITVFLARDLTPVPDDARYVRRDEEAGMIPVWVSLDDAVAAVLAGELHSPTAVVGVLAAAGARTLGWTTVTPVV